MSKFTVVEFSNIRAIQGCDVKEFASRDDAVEYVNKLTAEFRPADLHLGDEFGPLVGRPYPNPYKFDQKRAASLWEDKDPAWRDAMGKF